jgi:aminopeptidase N
MFHHVLRALALLTCFVAPCVQHVEAQARFDFDTAPGNLPKAVVPLRYTLALDLDPARDDFTGRADVVIDVRQQVRGVVLHARDLTASHAELTRDGQTRSLQVGLGPINQSWALEPADEMPIAPGRYTLRIDYSGRINRSGVGLFRADYVTAGKPEHMLATQLESIDARNVFPSFDEPAFRAVFELSVRAPNGLEVVSNMPRAVSRPDGDATLHRFQPTPPMPSYLLAVSVGRFDALAGRAAGVPLRILTAPGKRAQAAYAMGVTHQVVPFYDAYFGVHYALPKLDQQAVPSVRQGAMEDWGLISYSEDFVLFDPARSSPRTQRRVFSTVAHEIAHQWFGNLVTAASWEEIWLNEAFATWLAEKAAAHFNPLWRTDLERRLPLDHTMAGDAGNATRAIRSGPVSEGSVFDVFDSITYIKGGAVLGMLEQWLGEDVFRRGLGAYMRERKFSNATAGDLWHHLAQASRRDVASVAASWTDQPGYPLLEVEGACDGKRTRVTLSQRRLRDGTAPPPANVTAEVVAPRWQVPVRLARGSDLSTVLLTGARQSFELPGCRDVPLIANAGGIGFYRVKYDAALTRALAGRFVHLAPVDQVTLLSDTFALAQAGELPMESWFTLVAQIPQVAGPARTTLFDLAGTGFDFLDDALAGTPTQPLLRAAGRRVFGPELARLGWIERHGDDPQTLKLRGALIARLARFDDTPTIEEALKRFDADESGRAPLPASIRSQVLEATGMHADRARFDQLMARFKASGGEEDRWMYATALAGGRDEQRARELLAASLAGVTTPNIAIGLPGLVSSQSPFDELAYGFTLDHWDALAQIAGSVMWGRFWLLPNAASRFNDPARAAQLIDDQRRKAGADGAMPAARIASRIALLSTVRQRDAMALQTLLAGW